MDIEDMCNFTSSLLYPFHNCIGLWIFCTNGAAQYSIVIYHHSFVHSVVVWTAEHMGYIVDQRIPSQWIPLSKSICWILKICIILPIVRCAPSTIALACGSLVLMGLQSIPQSFAIIVLCSAQTFLSLSMIILSGKRYLVNQACST